MMCRLWYSLFEAIEKDNQGRLLSPEIVKQKEEMLLSQWTSPQNHDHGDAHGDVPHGDAHGDHMDYGTEAFFLTEKPEWLLTN